ncbi:MULTISPECIES: thiazole synthase [unclassified Rhizobium]|uniref:thiazole synthase n=1 Tax=unclassified Rhizobium TaxID=2613769 RepID=UPI000645E339|nr:MULTISPECIES: thiazole synthase [unclassified Rhizobium]OJY63873.1 MAG: thiazole synthase [Rhizobium sp. 60-20]RKD60867.1 thiazole-phosphate synthase [Rhizobium sp. WW_1]
MLELYGTEIPSRLLLGTARYPSPAMLAESVKRSQTGIVTVSLRRETAGGRNGGAFFEMIRELGVRVLPNTAGCHGVSEAVLTAKMAREVFRTNWIKLEVIGNHDTLQPDVFALVEAARILSDEGFEVFPYTTDDLIVAERLLDAGCQVLMPWCAPIGTAAGPLNLSALRSMRAHFPDVPLIVDAGIGRPSHAAIVMELGFDAVLLNTAVAGAGDPAAMAEAFAKAIDAGRQAFGAGMLEPRDMAVPSTPVIGKAVFS